MNLFRKMLIILAISISAVMLPMTASADEPAGGEHQHLRSLTGVIPWESKEGIPFCGRFYCSECASGYYDTLTPDDIGMPIINITGSLQGITKEKKNTIHITYMSGDVNFESDATIKWQGASSVMYPKKNYSIQFIKSSGSKNKVAIVSDWGKQSKYCLKANYIDFSQSRNIVSGRIYNEIVHSRDIDDELSALPNGGVVDGFPVALYLNGQYQGLYTLNIPKDKWMFGMKDETLRQALLFGDTWTESVMMREPILDVNNVGDSGWEIEYCSTEDDPEVGTAWAAESMNELIGFVNTNDGAAFREGIGQYMDVDRAIDVMLYTYFIHANDNVGKNIIWATYDGKRWIPSVYDMDGTWGMFWDGSLTMPSRDFAPGADNMVFKRLFDNYPGEIKERYVQLRERILTKSNLHSHFETFFSGICRQMYNAEKYKWRNVPNNDVDQMEQIYQYIEERVGYFDSCYGVEEQEYQEPVKAPAKPVISKLTPGKKKLTVRMKKKPAAAGASKYQIAYRLKGTSKWKTVTTGKQSCVIRKLKKGKKYQVRVRSYKAADGLTLKSGWTRIRTSGAVR